MGWSSVLGVLIMNVYRFILRNHLVFYENLVVAQLVKKFPVLLWMPKFHYHIHNNPPLDPTLSQFNPVHILTLSRPYIKCNILSFMSMPLISGISPWGFRRSIGSHLQDHKASQPTKYNDNLSPKNWGWADWRKLPKRREALIHLNKFTTYLRCSYQAIRFLTCIGYLSR
jgi:hypothetical protein